MKTKTLWVAGVILSAASLSAFVLLTPGHVKHIVVFKYKASATPDQIRMVTDAFKSLKGKIPGIVSFEYGVNNSPENLNKGFTHIYLLTFADVASRDSYLPHPDHKKFGELLTSLGVLEEPFVVDFVVNEDPSPKPSGQSK